MSCWSHSQNALTSNKVGLSGPKQRLCDGCMFVMAAPEEGASFSLAAESKNCVCSQFYLAQEPEGLSEGHCFYAPRTEAICCMEILKRCFPFPLRLDGYSRTLSQKIPERVLSDTVGIR